MFQVTSNSFSIQKLSKSGYANFRKTSTLGNDGRERIDATSEGASFSTFQEPAKTRILTDEELFNACGGRTAHKGARHGLNLSGKLSRIAEQEAVLLEKLEKNKNCPQKLFTETETEPATTIKAKKVKVTFNADTFHVDISKTDHDVIYFKTNKKKKKRRTPKNLDLDPDDLSKIVSLISLEETAVDIKKKRKKDKKNKLMKLKAKLAANEEDELPTLEKEPSPPPPATLEAPKVAKKRKAQVVSTFRDDIGYSSADESEESEIEKLLKADDSEPENVVATKSQLKKKRKKKKNKGGRKVEEDGEVFGHSSKKKKFNGDDVVNNLTEFEKKHSHESQGKLPPNKPIKHRCKNRVVNKMAGTLDQLLLSSSD